MGHHVINIIKITSFKNVTQKFMAFDKLYFLANPLQNH
jgi:hypothetical protein